MSIEKPQDPLMTLLGELPTAQERGFTERVMYQLHVRELRRRVILFTAWCCGFAGLVWSLPVQRLSAALAKLLHDSSTIWLANLANAEQITQTLEDAMQVSNFNIVVTLSAGAVTLVLVTFVLHHE